MIEAPTTLASAAAPLPRAGVRGRQLAVGGLLLCEAMYLGARFDTDGLADADAWWLIALSWAGQVTPLALSIATAVWMLGDSRRADARPAAPAPHRWQLFVAAHVAAFVVFFALTARLFEGDTAGVSPGLALAWVAAGAATIALGAASLVPAAALLATARQLGQPLLAGALVGSTAWAAGQLTELWWDPLRDVTFHAVRVLLAFASDRIVSDPTTFVIGTPEFAVEIAPICSGYQGIGLIWVFLGAYLWFFRDSLRFPQALLLLPIGTAAVWTANAVRIAALVMLGAFVSPTLAVGGFHAHAGALLFCLIALGLAAVARRVPFFDRRAATRTRSVRGPAEAYLVPLLVLLAAGMMSGALASGSFQPLHALRVVAAGGALWAYRRSYADLGLSVSWHAVAIGALAFVLWLVLLPAGEGGTEIGGHLAALPLPAAALWVAFRLIGTVVVVPMAEELAFRGFLLRRLIAHDFERVPPARFAWMPFVLSSFLFGAMHDALAAGTAAGMLYALAMHRGGRVGDAVVAHATTNALVALAVLAGGRWELWA